MDTLAWLSRLISFDTTSRNSNLALIDEVENWLQEQQILTQRSYDPKEKKANLFATIPAADNSLQHGLILSGHTDVVPVDGQDWNTNPFKLQPLDDNVFGRGTSDMKGFIAVILFLVPAIKQLVLKRPVHLALSYDEEIGCRGAPYMIADLAHQQINPSACIVGEPTSMRIIVGHKGIQVFRCRIKGKAAHSSLTVQGLNAIDYAAQLVNYIRKLADEIQRIGPFDKDYDVPFTTISTNQIQGGTANNIIPELCEVFFEFRNLPQVKPQKILEQIETYVQEELLPKMRQQAPEANIAIDLMGRAPSFSSENDSAIFQIASTVTGDKEQAKVAYATEAGLFQNAGIPTIICGPGSIEQAHKPNEFVSLQQLQRCEEVIFKIVQGYCC